MKKWEAVQAETKESEVKQAKMTNFSVKQAKMKTFAVSAELGRELRATGFLHRPLPVHYEKSLEALGLAKEVIRERVLCAMNNGDGWSGKGIGSIGFTGRVTPSGHGSLRLELPTTAERWPEEAPDGDYTPFGRQAAMFAVADGNWTAYNRVKFWIYPDCPGARCVNISLIYQNEGAQKIPDEYRREGQHQVNLLNRQWNECAIEIPELPRDQITMIGFESSAFGQDRSTGAYLRFDIGEIILQQVRVPESAHGWLPVPGRISYAMTGYERLGAKTAVMRPDGAAADFVIKNGGGETVWAGKTEKCQTALGDFAVLNFTELETAGEYRIKCGEIETPVFKIGDDIWGDSIWKTLNFILCERCGGPVADKHGSCHGDILARHNNLTLAFNGGWHDAGDMSQQTLQTGDVLFALLELINRTADRDLALRLTEEAEWGLDFILKCRFGDGYRASSAGIVNWSDGFIGNMDDQPARVQNNSFDNFLYAAYEAYAAMTLTDAMLCEKLTAVAAEDFDFAMTKYEQDGPDKDKVHWEHSYNTSESQYMATMSWSASMLYRLTGAAKYAEYAVRAINYVLACQNTAPIGAGKISGFFYRNRDRKVIQHFNHQSRDQVYMQALKELLALQPAHPDCERWKKCMIAFGAYLKKALEFVAPFGMLPAGPYHIDEIADRSSFAVQHLFPGENVADDYREQLENGIKLDDEHYFKIFPVWFSFRGNSAIHLATGKAAAICGTVLADQELLNIAREQLYWVVGKNPFTQSLLYGEGHNYPEQAVYLPGTMTGQLPVGIQTRNNEDLPYWPQANNATYKEAWLTVAGKWLSLIAEL